MLLLSAIISAVLVGEKEKASMCPARTARLHVIVTGRNPKAARIANPNFSVYGSMVRFMSTCSFLLPTYIILSSRG